MKEFLVILLIAVTSATTQAQKARISGYVTDKSSGETLIGANIIDETHFGTVTNSKGFFSISLDIGEKNISVSYVGYKTKTNEGSSGMIVRGGSSDQNLFILDGIPVYNTGHLFNFISVFNSDAVKRVDFYKGSFPARYGGSISESGYKYYKSLSEADYTNEDMFTIPSIIHSNIKEGYGIFAAYSTDTIKINLDL